MAQFLNLTLAWLRGRGWDGIIRRRSVPSLIGSNPTNWSTMPRPTRSYYQICKVDHQRNQEQMIAEVEGLHEAEKLVEQYLENMNSSAKKGICYRVSKILRGPADQLASD